MAIGFTITATTVAVVGSARVEGLGLNRKRYLKLNLTGGGYATAVTTVGVIELGRAYELQLLPSRRTLSMFSPRLYGLGDEHTKP